MQNHVIDPTYFYDAIEEFAFNYDAAVVSNKDIDDSGREVVKYKKYTVRGSLQPTPISLNQSKTGNTQSLQYNFYCKSLYRLNEGDFIYYKGRAIRVNNVTEYDEFGVRECQLECTDLTIRRNFNDFLNYLNGDEIV